MTDRPIIFSAPMVRALLDGRKTQTRRLPIEWLRWSSGGKRHKFTPELWAQATSGIEGFRRFEYEPGRVAWTWTSDPLPHQGAASRPLWIVYPVVQPGDRLWARENFVKTPAGPAFEADGGDHFGADRKLKITPCIHMPRVISRLTLTLSDARLQRLIDISEEDAIAEGVPDYSGWTDFERRSGMSPGSTTVERFTETEPYTRRWGFARLWSHLHSAESWAANPFVVPLTFTVERRNIDAPRAAA